MLDWALIRWGYLLAYIRVSSVLIIKLVIILSDEWSWLAFRVRGNISREL